MSAQPDTTGSVTYPSLIKDKKKTFLELIQEDEQEDTKQQEAVEVFREISDILSTSEEERSRMSESEQNLLQYLSVLWTGGSEVIDDFNELVTEHNQLLTRHNATQHSSFLTKEKEIEELHQEVDSLKRRFEAQKSTAEFMEARANENQVRAVEAEAEVRDLLHARGASVGTDAGRAKSERMPDPDHFDNGTPKEYRIWKRAIRNKLEVNNDRFDTNRKQVIYTLNRTKGRAAQLLNTYLDCDDHVLLNELFERMDEQFDDPNAINTARAQYIALRQNDREFADFIGDFRSLAQEARIPADMMVFDLRGKLRIELKQVAAAANPSSIADFISFLRNADRNLKSAGSYRNQDQKNPNLGQKSSALEKTVTNAGTTEAGTGSSNGRKQANLSTIRCYKCQKLGHFSSSCPSRSENGQPANK